MSEEDDRVWVGVDPGGVNNFGVAVLWPDGSAGTRCVSCADDAVGAVYSWLEGAIPAGVGVDAPLWWSSSRTGLRFADKWLRDTYGLPSNRVQAVNSLWGSVLVQGAMFVLRMREKFSDVGVTETHPKALLTALGLDAEGAFFQAFDVQEAPAQITEHERDAVISAVAAREGFEGNWTHDLSERRYPSEQDPSKSWLGPIHYYWPEG